MTVERDVILRLLDGWKAKPQGDFGGWPDCPDGPVWRFDYHPATMLGPKFRAVSIEEADLIISVRADL